MSLFGMHLVLSALACLIHSTWTLPLQAERHEPHEHWKHPHWENETCEHPHHHPPLPPPPPPPKWRQRNLNTITSIYNLTIYPNQLPILGAGAAGVPPGLFNENATGRVDPVGNFTGFDDSIEYFFALAPVPKNNAASTAITSIKITEFSSACPTVAASVVYLFCNVEDPTSPLNGLPLAPLKEVAFWKFDDAGAVLKYDAWIPNLNDWIVAGLGIEISNPSVAAASIQQLCGGTQQMCFGPNAQWNSVEECIAVLSGKQYGNYDEAWGDNIVCRTIHLVLTQVRPDVHCPHVGPTGGGKCVDYAYPLQYFADEALYGDPLGGTFTCDPSPAPAW